MSGIYISYPFCNQKCSFCNFASGVFSAGTKSQYHRLLENEVRAHTWSWLPETLYFGGGTPSLMPPELLVRLINAIPKTRLTEITLECAPGTLTAENVEQWARCGINRVSLGVQSFVTAELRQTGRCHDAEVVSRDIALLRSRGIQNINIDLIAGLPGQTAQSWQHSLEWLERLMPPHVSVYIFEIDEDSRLGNELLLGGTRYGAPSVPGDDAMADFYEAAVERLTLLAIERYEISNFARPGFQSRHNLKYWQLEPYIGFGLDAHSFDGARRWSNPDTFVAYFTQQESGLTVLRNTLPANVLEERFFVGLRLMRGIEPTVEEWSNFARPIQKHLNTGMLERDGNRLRLSSRAVLLSNEILEEFIHA